MLSFIVSLLLISSLNLSGSLQPEPFFNLLEKTEQSAPERINPINRGVKVAADKYIVVDLASGKILTEKNSLVRQPIASITKLMTALVILDQEPNWQKTVELKAVDETVGAFPHIFRGERVKFIDLWKAALISSDNNAIMAMIRTLGFSREEFVELMNKKANSLLLRSTEFADPTGLSEYNLSNAHDVVKLLEVALTKNEIKESVTQANYEFQVLSNDKIRKIKNTDVLINSFLNSSKYGYELVGGKTGFIPEAGYCLTTKIKYNDKDVLIVVLNSATIDQRFQDTKVLADWVFSNYKW